jgi:hypothetical protein
MDGGQPDRLVLHSLRRVRADLRAGQTVEGHLTHMFQKLDIAAHTERAAALGTTATPAAGVEGMRRRAHR